MADVRESQATIDRPSAAGTEWLNWTVMADYEAKEPPVVVTGDGPYVTDADGSRLLDAMSGLFTTQIGYSHGKEIGQAAAAQLEQLGFYPNWGATHPSAVKLTERILGLAPRQMGRAFFTSGGSEAVESALKLARQHFLAKGEPARRKVIARRGAYHGCSLGALSLTGIPAARAPFEPLLENVRHVVNTDVRRCTICDGDVERHLKHAAEAVEDAIRAEAPGTVMAVVVEPVQNAGGCLVPPEGYAQRLREICDRHGVLLWCDEVITGFGRIGEWFGSTRLGFEPDMITFAKGATSGHAPLGGVLFTDEIAEPVVDANAMYAHGFTFGGHPLSCAVSLKNLEIMERLDVLANVRENEDYLEQKLNEVAERSDIAVEARGIGYFRALELVSNDVLVPARDAIRRRGAIVRVDNRVNPFLAISMPLICDREHIDELADSLTEGLAAAS
jgi:adenosylmethionine-8-amino-7-oxononanoate aminotransferase